MNIISMILSAKIVPGQFKNLEFAKDSVLGTIIQQNPMTGSWCAVLAREFIDKTGTNPFFWHIDKNNNYQGFYQKMSDGEVRKIDVSLTKRTGQIHYE